MLGNYLRKQFTNVYKEPALERSAWKLLQTGTQTSYLKTLIDWKGLPWTNTLTYYEHSQISNLWIWNYRRKRCYNIGLFLFQMLYA
jgi:hypothetical protein